VPDKKAGRVPIPRKGVTSDEVNVAVEFAVAVTGPKL